MTDASPSFPRVERSVDHLQIPADALVILVGPSGCGKSTFARANFTETEVVSSDGCRRLVADDEANQSASREAFVVFDAIIEGRLAHGRRAVADATNIMPWTRERLRDMAAAYGRPTVALAFDVPLDVCIARQRSRPRSVPDHVVAHQHENFQHALAALPTEGYAHLYIIRPRR